MERECSIKKCINNHYAKGYCIKHYYQVKRHGHILKRTSKDRNEIISYENYAEIVIYNKQCEEIARTLVDLDDVDKVKDTKWGLNNYGYVTNKKCGDALIHRVIMNAPKKMVVDHKNNLPLDNRKENLRICTQTQNMQNSSMQKSNTSGILGVYWDKNRNKWVAQIRINNKTVTLGRYEDIEEAEQVRKDAELKYYGEFAPIHYKG